MQWIYLSGSGCMMFCHLFFHFLMIHFLTFFFLVIQSIYSILKLPLLPSARKVCHFSGYGHEACWDHTNNRNVLYVTHIFTLYCVNQAVHELCPHNVWPAFDR